MIKNIEARNDSVKINDKEIAILKEHFSSCFQKDGSFDIAKLQEQLKDKVDIIHEGYELKFLGKSYAKLLTSIETTTIIKPDTEHNDKPENKNSENIYISGDNLDGLKHLLKSYSRQVKCIYIDPPYNTGTDGFIYNDNFNFTNEELQRKLSIDETQALRIIDLTKRKSCSHSAWLMFMYCRLQLAKDLLTHDGVIFISVDDNEQANLKLLCDDVFGEENFLGCIVRATGTTTGQDANKFGSSFDYCLSYRRSEKFNLFGLSLAIKDLRRFKNDDNDGKGKYALLQFRKTGNADRKEDREKMFYPVIAPDENKIYPVGPGGYLSRWRMSKKKYEYYVTEGLIVWKKQNEIETEEEIEEDDELEEIIPEENGENGNDIDTINLKINNTYLPYVKYYLEGRKKKPSNLWTDIDGNKKGSIEIKELFKIPQIFSNPKPKDFIKRMVGISCSKNDIILDFFSGSATTSNAIMELNAEDGGNRKYICVQLPEELDPKNPQQKAAFDFLTSINRPTTLNYIGIERIIRAAKKIKEETNADIDYGFKHFELCEVNQNTLDKCESFDKATLIADSSILDDFGTASVLTTWLVNDGYGFNADVKIIDLKGYTAYYCKKHLYLINPNLTQDSVADLFEKYDSIAGFNPENIILFGYSFNEWSVTDMLEKNLKVLDSGEKNLKINIDVRY